ncbi:hypothetical protein [Methylobacterium sp. 285MFTsu5.1]|uniref:hypothetical protein n=1 Tax=Methylobacterium sp. 285MFTsu5.1 TaxID=1172187 RepID=UPI00037870B3|nr:hypothetical protein [Methylobacterium sp. 285MFTsu5.1]
MAKRDPWWPIQYGDECGASYMPHKRILLPSGIEVFAVDSETHEGVYRIAVMREPGLHLNRNSEIIPCSDTLELRAKLLALAYPEG